MQMLAVNLFAVAKLPTRDVLTYLGVIVAAAVVIVAVALVIRKRLLGSAEEGTGFTLSDMRRLHAEGKLSDEEFEAARSRMIDRLKTEHHLGDETTGDKNISPHESDKDPGSDA